MYICTEHAKEIVHENRKCPFCDKEAKMQSEIDKLEEQVKNLQQEIDNFSDEV